MSRSLGVIMNGVTGRMGMNQHLTRSIAAIRAAGGVALKDGTRVEVEPVLVGRNGAKLAELAAAHAGLRWSTDLDAEIASPANQIFFDAATTQMRPALLEKAIARAKKVKQGNPLEPSTMIGAQASNDQLEEILSYVDIGKKEGAKLLAGGERAKLNGDLTEGYYMQPTVFEGNNKMRIFQEEIFGPVLSVTPFDTEDEALAIANDTLYGLGAGVWTRDINRAYSFGRGIKAGRVWTNCYHLYPAHAAFGGYKKSGIGRETHKMMLDHYQQTKNVLVSYSQKPLGFF